MKGVNVRSLSIESIAQGTQIKIGLWKGNIDITIAQLHGKKIYLEINFLNTMKALHQYYVHHGDMAILYCPFEEGDR